MVSQLLPTNSTQRDLPFIPLGILDVQQRTVIGVRDLHGHDCLVTGHELISDHLQVRLALRDDVLLGADLQQFEIPVDHLQLAQAVGGDHHLVVGILDGLRLNLNVGHQIGGNLLQLLWFVKYGDASLITRRLHVAEHSIPVLSPHPYTATATILEGDIVVVISLKLTLTPF